MVARDILQAAADAEKDLRLIREQRRHILDIATSSSVGGEVYVAPSGSSKVERAAVKMADLEEDLIKAEADYERKILRARKLIARLDKERFREVLTLRYICCKPWKDVTDSMGYQDEKSAFRVHSWALKAADEILRRMRV